MTGVLYGREPGDESGPIHLWERDGDDHMETSCGELRCEIVASSNSSVKITSGDAGKVLMVTQQESFKQANSGYCLDCLENHPRASKFIPNDS